MADDLLDRYLARIAAIEAIPDSGARNDAMFDLTKEMIGPRARWADSDPEVAARWLVARGAEIDHALVTADKFEWDMRALYALDRREDAPTFEALAAFIDEIEGRSA